MEDERRPVRTQQPPTAARPATEKPLPEPRRPEPETETDEPDDEVMPDGRYEPL